jgi:hypothetical protein
MFQNQQDIFQEALVLKKNKAVHLTTLKVVNLQRNREKDCSLRLSFAKSQLLFTPEDLISFVLPECRHTAETDMPGFWQEKIELLF